MLFEGPRYTLKLTHRLPYEYGTLYYARKTAEVKPASHFNTVPSLKLQEAKRQYSTRLPAMLIS